MRWLTEDAVLVCAHEVGLVGIKTSQNFVTVNRRRVLIDDNPETCPIVGCPNTGPSIKPCTQTLKVREGYSKFIRIEGQRICLETVVGLTDGTPPGTVIYKVRNPGQNFVREET